MMKEKKKYLYYGLFLVLLMGILLWLGNNATFLKRQYQTISGRLLKETITIKELKQAMKEQQENGKKEFGEIVLWKQGEIEEIVNPTLKNNILVPTIIAYGSMEVTTPMELYCGTYVYKEDKNGCVIDVNTANELFGNTNIIGKVIACGNKQYEIRGVVKTKRPIFLRQSMEDEKVKFNQLEFVFEEDLDNKIQAAKLFLIQYGKGEDAVYLDGILYGTIAQRFSTLPYFTLSACMFFLTIKNLMKKGRKGIYQSIFFMVIVLGYTAGLYYYIGNPFYMPSQWIPTKWSDFDFWTAKWKEIKEQIQIVRYLVPNTKDVMLMDIFYQSLFGILCSILLILENIRRIIKVV